MLSVLPLWLTLNVYAFLLDALALAGGTGAWLLFLYEYPVLGVIAGAAAAAFLYSAIRVHLSYPAKLKAYHTLYQRNRDVLHPNSFHEFMGSPCYRMVVRAVLCRTGHPEEYDAIFKAVWGTGMPCFAPKPATVTIFKNAAEGARWLEQHRSPAVGGIPDSEASLDGNRQKTSDSV